MRIASLILPLILLAAAICEEIHVRIIDGRNGHFRSDSFFVEFFENDKEPKTSAQLHIVKLKTDAHGIATLAFAPTDRSISFAPGTTLDCRYMKKQVVPNPRERILISDILQFGVAVENQCGKLTLTPKPGELVMFVRPWHWWERITHMGDD